MRASREAAATRVSKARKTRLLLVTVEGVPTPELWELLDCPNATDGLASAPVTTAAAVPTFPRNFRRFRPFAVLELQRLRPSVTWDASFMSSLIEVLLSVRVYIGFPSRLRESRSRRCLDRCNHKPGLVGWKLRCPSSINAIASAGREPGSSISIRTSHLSFCCMSGNRVDSI